jgi:hypothetical protein
LPLQQPFGHEVASQMHWPLALHACPVAHPPQVAPELPQEVPDCDAYSSHAPVAPPTQQPLGHVVASQEQVPFVVSHTPFVHEAQAAPAAPHWALDSEE